MSDNGVLISVVVPIYNVEKYLEDCIKSILSQSYMNIEIILVDDGSSDSCPAICDKYECIDQRIKVIHKENGGLSDARNSGLEIAKGKYITFIDSDDYVGESFILRLYRAISETGAEISMCNYVNVGEESKEILQETEFNYKTFDNRECLKRTYVSSAHGMEFVAWGKLYDISLFHSNSILYPKGKLHEDTYTTYKLYFFAKKIVFICNTEYYYRNRSGSIMTASFNLKRLSSIEATKSMCKFFLEKGDEELLTYAVNLHLKTCLKMYFEISTNYNGKDKDVQKSKVIEKYRKDYRNYKGKGNFGIAKKVFFDLVYLYPNLKLLQKKYHF